MTKEERLRQQEGMTTDSDSKTTNLLDETLTLAHASKQRSLTVNDDGWADLQSRLQQVEQECDRLRSLFNAKCATCGQPTGENWYRCLQCESYFCKRCLEDHVKDGMWSSWKDKADRWKELATEIPWLMEVIRDLEGFASAHHWQASAEDIERGRSIRAKYDALQQEEDAR